MNCLYTRKFRSERIGDIKNKHEFFSHYYNQFYFEEEEDCPGPFIKFKWDEHTLYFYDPKCKLWIQLEIYRDCTCSECKGLSNSYGSLFSHRKVKSDE